MTREIQPRHPLLVWRQERKVPQEILAQDAGIATSTLSKIERSKSKVSAETALKLARITGLTVEQIASKL